MYHKGNDAQEATAEERHARRLERKRLKRKRQIEYERWKKHREKDIWESKKSR